MFHDFDPYDELMAHRHNIGELIRAINEQSGYLREMAQQHEQLTKLLRDQSTRLHQLEIKLDALKKS
jgi:hypothetical protein